MKSKSHVHISSVTVVEMTDSIAVVKKTLAKFAPRGRCNWKTPTVYGTVLVSDLAMQLAEKIVSTFSQLHANISRPCERDDEGPTFGELINLEVINNFRQEMVSAKNTCLNILIKGKKQSLELTGVLGTLVDEVMEMPIYKLFRKYEITFKSEEYPTLETYLHIDKNTLVCRLVLSALDFLTYGIPKDLRAIRNSPLSSIWTSFEQVGEVLKTTPPKSRAVYFATNGVTIDVLYETYPNKRRVWLSNTTTPKAPTIGVGEEVRIFRIIKPKGSDKFIYSECSVTDTLYASIAPTIPRKAIVASEAPVSEGALTNPDDGVVEDPTNKRERLANKLAQLQNKFNRVSA